jgi:hypothetical protein
VPGPGRSPRDRGEASYRDDFLADMVEPNDLGRLPFVEMTADGITDFSMKFRNRVSFSENRKSERSCDEPALRCVFYHKNQLAHGHFSKMKEQILCRYGIPGATQCPVREASLTREACDEQGSSTAMRREMSAGKTLTLGLKSVRPCQGKTPGSFSAPSNGESHALSSVIV